jgi:hypothetical protein
VANQIIKGDPGSDPRSVTDWLHIDDFSPGCYDNSFISTADPKFSAPLGAADANATFCCASLSNGALGPLPALTTTGVYPTGLPGAASEAFITGFIVNPGLDDVNDELIIIWEADDGTTHYVSAYSDVWALGPGGLNQILASNSGSVAGYFGAPYPTWTRMNVGGTGNPPPVLVFPGAVTTDANGTNGHLYVYPPILAPTTFAVQDLIVGMSSVTGQVIAYGNRILVLAGIDYPWPAGGGINTNENINFTDPPQSSDYGDQMTILGSEWPWGYGAWGDVSVGQLMLIKKYGGGIQLYGDIFEPTSVIEEPGIQPTGDFVGRADPGENGLVYCSEKRGAWVWDGGNVSNKISPQLRDDFYDATTPTGMESNNYGFYVQHWQDWVLFSNNYLFNPDTGGWWVLYPNDTNGTATVTGHTMWWFSPGRFGNQMYAAPLRFGTAPGLTRNWWYLFDNAVPAPNYQWTSLPIHVVPAAQRVVDVLQANVRISDPSNSGAATFSITINGEVFSVTGTIGTVPYTYRFNCGEATLGLQDIDITLKGGNTTTNSAPIVHSLDIGFKTRAMNPSDN